MLPSVGFDFIMHLFVRYRDFIFYVKDIRFMLVLGFTTYYRTVIQLEIE